MPYLDPAELQTEVSGSLRTVRTPFWSVTHDLARGGEIVDIRFTNGQEGNVLLEPMETRLDGLSDLACSSTSFRQRHTRQGLELVFEGHLSGRDGEGSSVRFRTTWVYTPYSLRREVVLSLPRGLKAKSLSPLRMVVDSRFDYYSAAHDPHENRMPESGLGPGYFAPITLMPPKRTIFSGQWPPGWLTLLRTGGESLQIIPSGDLGPWDAPAGQTGQGLYTLRRRRGGWAIEMDVLHVERPSDLPRQLVFAASIGLLNLPPSHPHVMRMSMIGNPPFPEDSLLEAWAASGCELLVIMEGTRWVGNRDDSPGGSGYYRSDTDRYWRMGGYPPYSREEDNRDLARMVATAHRLGMKVVPYTAPAEIHPELPEFSKNVLRWRQQVVSGGGTTFHSTGNYPGAIWGALICPDSKEVQDFYVGFASRYVRDYGFDGIYVDLASKVYCHNTGHGPAHHGGIDGLWAALTRLREFLGPDKLIIAHNGDCNMLVSLSNLADNVVTMEAINSNNKLEWDLGIVRPYIRGLPACGNMMIPKYSWFWDSSPKCRRAWEDGIAKSVLLGSIPFHLDIYFDNRKWGYKSVAQGLRDPRGIWQLFKRVRGLDLEGMQFDDVLARPVRTSRKGVLGARYRGKGRQVIVLSNLTPKTQENIRWKCDGAEGTVKRLASKDYCFISVRE